MNAVLRSHDELRSEYEEFLRSEVSKRFSFP
jgi:hypothetical protein